MRFFGWCPCPGSNTHWKDKFLPKPGIFKLFCERHMAERRPRSRQSLFFMYPQPREGWTWRLCYNHKRIAKMGDGALSIRQQNTPPSQQTLRCLDEEAAGLQGPSPQGTEAHSPTTQRSRIREPPPVPGSRPFPG